MDENSEYDEQGINEMDREFVAMAMYVKDNVDILASERSSIVAILWEGWYAVGVMWDDVTALSAWGMRMPKREA